MEYKEQLTIYTKELEECVDIIISERKRYEEIKTNINKLMDTISIVSNKYSDGSFKVEYSVNYSDKEIADKIIKIVSDVSGMTQKSILSPNRKKRIHYLQTHNVLPNKREHNYDIESSG